MADKIPKTMKALQVSEDAPNRIPKTLEEWSQALKLVEVPVPKPKTGEVLIRVERSPCNPADMSSVKGSYDRGSKPSGPFIPGFEGSGTTVASGGGILAWSMVNKRVASASGPNGGFWAEYVCVPATSCLVLPDNVTFDIGASSFVNPLTVLSFIEIARTHKAQYIVHTAGASSLGKMLIRTAKKQNINIIAVVRRHEQIEELKRLGAVEVFNTSNEGWEKDFSTYTRSVNCQLAFDAVAGELTGKLLRAMPKGSVVKVYGGLAEQPCSISPSDLIFEDKKLEGFWLSRYIQAKNLIGLVMWQQQVKNTIASDLRSDIQGVYPLEQFAEGLSKYVSNMSAGKVLLAPRRKVEIPKEKSTTEIPIPSEKEAHKQSVPPAEAQEEKKKEVLEEVKVASQSELKNENKVTSSEKVQTEEHKEEHKQKPEVPKEEHKQKPEEHKEEHKQKPEEHKSEQQEKEHKAAPHIEQTGMLSAQPDVVPKESKNNEEQNEEKHVEPKTEVKNEHKETQETPKDEQKEIKEEHH
eukprot:TRINITY_DN1693_c0_g1_i1.p1 TRINITY_DN1693_c0_g1~~TRINITY_DN1693_c0_g1_i1.p1  ORF type:complete len:523 (-),score=117.65 TRINITY_DN1693_c0_g1_i1:57-1625(-)